MAQLLPEDDAQHRKGQTEPHRQQVQGAHALQSHLGEQQRRASGEDDPGQQPLSGLDEGRENSLLGGGRLQLNRIAAVIASRHTVDGHHEPGAAAAMDSASSAVLFSTQLSQANTTTRARHTSATVTQTFPTFFFMVLSSFLHLVFVFRYL